MHGKPATKRKKSSTENKGKHKVSKAGKKVKCNICKVIGHNKATCPERRPQKLNVKRQKKQKVSVKQNAGEGTSNEGQQHEEVQMTPIECVANVQVHEVLDDVQVHEGVANVQVQEVVANVQVQEVVANVHHNRVRPISEILKRIRRRKSERMLKLKLGKKIGGCDDVVYSKGKALVID
ncbi:unnamed protein product [Lactuca virosa]|uniref:Uncharacterized protein n=1 Tax=Lactuca virosa TaxID=75947 RepID=A0AAU9NT40_9ASTR|nr:unnamed protein product [Lactuca virosa]